MRLSNVIYKVSRKREIPAHIYTAILMQESGYSLDAVGIRCGYSKKYPREVTCVETDFGISQIHYKTVERENFDVDRLTTDLEYSVDAGAKVLQWFYKVYAHREKDWWVRFNIGTRSRKSTKVAWEQYHSKVLKYFPVDVTRGDK